MARMVLTAAMAKMEWEERMVCMRARPSKRQMVQMEEGVVGLAKVLTAPMEGREALLRSIPTRTKRIFSCQSDGILVEAVAALLAGMACRAAVADGERVGRDLNGIGRLPSNAHSFLTLKGMFGWGTSTIVRMVALATVGGLNQIDWSDMDQ
jgi:hypothetical protein